MRIRTALALAALASSPAAAAERTPANLQDPPGRVSVDQPAGVTFEQRDTPRDTTDSMHGSTYADLRAPGVTPEQRGSAAPRRASVEEPKPRQEQPARAQPQTGGEVRTSRDTASGSSIGAPTGPATGTAADTALGTDIGHGTGTEQPAKR